MGLNPQQHQALLAIKGALGGQITIGGFIAQRLCQKADIAWIKRGMSLTAVFLGSVVGFVCCFLVIISMYGGGFSTVPAYLKDMFGTRYLRRRGDGVSYLSQAYIRRRLHDVRFIPNSIHR